MNRGISSSFYFTLSIVNTYYNLLTTVPVTSRIQVKKQL